MHNGYIMVDGEKMSKSLNNFFTVRDIRKEYDGDFIRFFLLSVQYRGPINFSDEGMKQVKQGYDRLVNAEETLEFLVSNGYDGMTKKEEQTASSFEDYKDKFIECMSDDLNTAGAIGAIFELVSAINVEIEGGASKEFAEKALSMIQELADVLGVLQRSHDDTIGDDIRRLVDERQQARKEKDWARADEIRDQLSSMGYILKDTPQGVQIIKADA